MAVCLAIAGCGGAERVTDEDELRAAITATEGLARTLTYSDASVQGTVQVKATIEDDLRYQADISVDKKKVYREVIRDDAISARVLDEIAFDMLAEEEGVRRGSQLASDRKVRGALLAGKWVEDKLGAPPLVGAGGDEAELGDDPITDALTALDYVANAIGTSAGVTEFDPDSLAYQPDEDPFPQPDLEAGVSRYDLERPPLPRTQDTDASGTRSPPSIEHFRKMSVYVQDGKVTKVLELIEVLTLLDDLETRFGVTVPEGVSGNEQADLAMEQVNKIRSELGQQPIRVRAMELVFAEHGADLRVQAPRKTTLASLSLLKGRGRAVGPAATEAPEDGATPGPDPVVAPPAGARAVPASEAPTESATGGTEPSTTEAPSDG